MKMHGRENDLIDRVRNSGYFAPIHDQLDRLMEPSTFVGRAPEQTVAFISKQVKPALAKYADQLQGDAVISI